MNTSSLTPENSDKKAQTKTGIASLLVSVIATIASIRALMYINFGVHSPANASIYHWAVTLSLILPFVSIILGFIGVRNKKKSNLLGSIGIGASLFLLSTVGFAYLLSSLF